VDAFDANLDTIEYIYESENGSIFGSGPDVIWQAPTQAGEYQLTIKAFDSIFFSSPHILDIIVIENNPPVIQQVNCNESIIEPGDIINFTINASDPDGHNIQYIFDSSDGELFFKNLNVTWYSPDEPGIYIVTINISDGHNGYDQRELFIIVGNPDPNFLIKSFTVQPDKIHKGESTEILIKLEIDVKYKNLIDRIEIELSKLTGNPSQSLFDTGVEGDEIENDGIYSYKFQVKIDDFTGEYQIQANIKTTIPNYEFNTSTDIVIEDKPIKDSESNLQSKALISLPLILILIIIIVLFIRFRRKKAKMSEESEDKKLHNESKNA
jgi:hypothetical protein